MRKRRKQQHSSVSVWAFTQMMQHQHFDAMPGTDWPVFCCPASWMLNLTLSAHQNFDASTPPPYSHMINMSAFSFVSSLNARPHCNLQSRVKANVTSRTRLLGWPIIFVSEQVSIASEAPNSHHICSAFTVSIGILLSPTHCGQNVAVDFLWQDTFVSFPQRCVLVSMVSHWSRAHKRRSVHAHARLASSVNRLAIRGSASREGRTLHPVIHPGIRTSLLLLHVFVVEHGESLPQLQNWDACNGHETSEKTPHRPGPQAQHLCPASPSQDWRLKWEPDSW